MSRPSPSVLQEQLKQVALVLLQSGAREVYMFGSSTKGTPREGSDIDLAVSGLPPELFYKAMGRVGDILALPFDLVDLDEETPFTRYLKEEQELVRIA